MNNREITIRALENMKGDDTYRAECAFLHFTPKQMDQPHGMSGKTRAEILAGYRAHDAQINAAISWVKSCPT